MAHLALWHFAAAPPFFACLARSCWLLLVDDNPYYRPMLLPAKSHGGTGLVEDYAGTRLWRLPAASGPPSSYLMWRPQPLRHLSTVRDHDPLPGPGDGHVDLAGVVPDELHPLLIGHPQALLLFVQGLQPNQEDDRALPWPGRQGRQAGGRVQRAHADRLPPIPLL